MVIKKYLRQGNYDFAKFRLETTNISDVKGMKIVAHEVVEQSNNLLRIDTIFQDTEEQEYYKLTERFTERAVERLCKVEKCQDKWVEKLPLYLELLYKYEKLDDPNMLVDYWADGQLHVVDYSITDCDENEYTKRIIIKVIDKYFEIEFVVPYEDNTYVENIRRVNKIEKTVTVFE